MKTIKFTAILMIAMVLSVKLMAQEQLVVPLSDPGKPYKLNIDLVSGTINITGYDGKDIIVEVGGDKRKNDDRDRGDHNGMHRITGGDNLDVTAKEKNNTVSINSGSPMKAVVLNIKVPQSNAHMKLATINNGHISVNNVNGDFEVSNINGAINMENVTGSVVANTVNGGIKVFFKSVDPKAAMAFSTLNGNINVTFPANLKANFKLKSDRENIYTDFDMVTDKSAPKVTKTVKDGMYRLTMDEWVYGKIDGGGPEIMMKTMNGSIYIKKAK
ncbi:hypothetical protein KXQ82_03100 [Mucilaginibacter sp. HMF5004]|uniref:DUF4097 family beta strand repeat-containing protein n=1 Tax=Mucilaginibacter rivuli TaxID=2857527 RepID=UPI001C5E29A2|nr:hypothetical protein [Mucilaginibacter rivuli]MBW4888680.1 hypothetical protein [Mucilaginibacter rivuli]